MDHAELARLAGKTADAIEARGLARGTLAEGVTYYIHPRSGELAGLLAGAELVGSCAVCALGAMSIAFFGTPMLGYFKDGNGYEEFLIAVANWLVDNDSFERPVFRASGVTKFLSAKNTIFVWSDTAEKEEVVGLFRAMAEDWSTQE